MHNEVCFDAVVSSYCCSMNSSDASQPICCDENEARSNNVEDLSSELFKFGHSQAKTSEGADSLLKPLCNNCKAREEAVAVCKDCKDNLLCLNCVSAHRFMNCFEGHRIESNSDYSNSVTEADGIQVSEDVFLQQIFECKKYCGMLNDLLLSLAHILSSVKTITNELVQDVTDVKKTLKFSELLSMQSRSEDQIHQIIKLAIKIAVNFKDLYESVEHGLGSRSFVRCKHKEVVDHKQLFLTKVFKDEENINGEDVVKTNSPSCHSQSDAAAKFCTSEEFDMFPSASTTMVSYANNSPLLWSDVMEEPVTSEDGVIANGFLTSTDCYTITSTADLLSNSRSSRSSNNRYLSKQSTAATTVFSSKHSNGRTVNNLLDLINIQHAISQKAPQVNIGKDGNVYVNNEKTSFTVPSNGTVTTTLPREPVENGMPAGSNICCPIINGSAAPLSDHSSRSITPLDDRCFANGFRSSASTLTTPTLCGTCCDVISAQPIPPCNASSSVIAANNSGLATLSSVHSYPGGGNLNPPVRFNGKMTPMQIRHKFGSLGPAKGQFNSPHGFCLGLDEEIIIADTNNHRIQVFDKCGEFKYQFGVPGRDEGQLWYPRKVVVMRHNGKFVVCDRGNERSRMQLFSKNGHFIKKIAIRYIDIVAGLAITPQGHIVAVDSVSPTVFCISESGDLLKWFDCSDYMREPSDIVINGKEYFVCDFKGHCVVVFNEDGVFLRRIGCENVTNFPNGIDISDAGDILVGDSHGNRFHVAVFSRDGSLLSEFECPYVKVSRCCGLKITSDGYIVTLAKNNHHVLVLNTLFIA